MADIEDYYGPRDHWSLPLPQREGWLYEWRKWPHRRVVPEYGWYPVFVSKETRHLTQKKAGHVTAFGMTLCTKWIGP